MKAIGYFISTISVILLGVVAWPKSSDPSWKAVVLVGGLSASLVGLLLRYLAYRQEQADKSAVRVQRTADDDH